MATLSSMLSVSASYAEAINIEFGLFTSIITKANKATETLNNKLIQIAESTKSTGIEMGTIFSVLKDTAMKGMKIADDFTNTNIRIGAMSNSLEEQLQLQKQIFDSANRSRSVYSDMANAITKMGLSAPDMFGSNDELIAFTELVQKGIKLGGAEQSVQSDTMSQITEAMASGTLQGDDFSAIMENAPMLAEAISEATGKSITELQAMASEGEIASNIFKNAVLMDADDINARFEAMPYTFADTMDKIKNGAAKAFLPLIEAISNLGNSNGFQSLVDTIIMVMTVIANGWSVIGPILAIITGLYLVLMIAQLWAMVAPVAFLTASWLAMHAPLLLVVGAIFAMLYALDLAGVTMQDIFGVVGGLIGALIMAFRNMAAAISNIFIGITKGIYEIVTGFINMILDGVSNIIKSLNEIHGVNIKEPGRLNESSESLKFYGFGSLTDAYNKGSQLGQDAYKGISDKLSGIKDDLLSPYNKSDDNKSDDERNGFDTSGFGAGNSPLSIVGTGSGGAVNVDMSDEDLKYLRDIAERDYINKFSTATLAPNIQVTFGDVHETADANAVAGRIKTILQEEIAMSAEGAYR